MPRYITVFAFLAAGLATGAAEAQSFDSDLAWPLCGRISEAPPVGWSAQDGCPAERWGNADFSDLPLSSTFGPRPLTSENERYDFHRGLDIGTPIGTPVFAITDGEVVIAGEHSSYSDPVVQIRHFRPGATSCNDGGCYHSNNLHMSGWAVSAGQSVVKGQLIGHTGISASGFAHLHFEIRDAPADDPYSRWQRDAIHPLSLLAYADPSLPAISFLEVNDGDPLAPEVSIEVVGQRLDIERVELTLYDDAGDIIPQPGNTPDPLGYNVHPAWFAMTEWNRQYTHKNSSSVPWESFGYGGERECPYHADHGATYDANVHMDAQHPDDFHIGRFNSITVRTTDYDYPGDYTLDLTFHELAGPATCIVATIGFTGGGSTGAEWGICGGGGGGGGGGNTAPVAEAQSVSTSRNAPVAITLGASDADGDTLTFDIVQWPAHGTLSGGGTARTYTPDNNYTGKDAFVFSVADGNGGSDAAEVSINVRKGGGGGGNGGGGGGGGGRGKPKK
jgi:murein DD-endopeptidase MepM/ murein hydrolase activator NlpD